MNNYWINREQKIITDKSIEEVQEQLKKYYTSAMKQTIKDFEATYDKVLTSGEQITPANLYKLDKYWQTQAQLQYGLQKLGDKTILLMQRKFLKEYSNIYKSLAIKGETNFHTIDDIIANQLINQVWALDGKVWSQRVWENTSYLQQTLNEELIHCCVSGKKTSQLKSLLQDRFSVSYNRANTLAVTELAHIETVSAAQKYKDYGLEKYEILVSPDDRTCDICAPFDKKQFYLSEMKCGVNAPPFHPNCRDSIIAVI